MKLVLSWLREFVDLDASAGDIASTIGLRGFEVAAIEDLGGGDGVIDFEVTANRPDCLSVVGLAREVATAYDRPLLLPGSEGAGTAAQPAADAARAANGSADLTVSIEDPDLCPRYAAAVAEVRIGPSPAWMAERLLAAGIRPISTIVDITNYVNIEIG